MDQKKFEALLILIVPKVVELIVDNYKCDEIEAIKNFYQSEVYSVLEQEDTKLWHFSPLTLFNMYDEELKTGSISFPEEAHEQASRFLIYCVEMYKDSKGLSGKQVAQLFSKFQIWDYIYKYYEALHTTGAEYIIDDIDQFIEVRS